MPLSDFAEMPLDEQKSRGVVFTPREIAQQPETWRKTFEQFRSERESICGFLEQAGVRDVLEARPTVWLIGAGTSDYIGQSLALLLREKWGCEVTAVASTDLLPNMSAYVVPGRKYLWISFSRSGDSPEGVAVLKRAVERYPEVTQLVVTCNADGAMGRISKRAANAYVALLDDAVNDRSLVMTSSFSNMVIFGQCLAHAWSLEEYAGIVATLADAGTDFLRRSDDAAEALASEELERVCFVGSGTLAGAAQECSLKLLEMTAGRVKTTYETILGLRHGPMAVLDTNTLFVCSAPGDDARSGYAFDLLAEVGAKQIVRKRIVIGPESSRERFEEECELYLPLTVDVDDAYRPVLDVIFGQILGLYCSVSRGLKPDSPSAGGVISRVVGQFAIY